MSEATGRTRVRFLYVILAVLAVASVGPLLFYAIKMLALNRQALETNEQELQNTTTRSIAEEISIYNENFHQLLDDLDHVLQMQANLSGGKLDSGSPELQKTLERFVSPSNHIVYVTFLNAGGRGAQAGNYGGESDPFLVKILQRAFAASQQQREFQSDPVLISPQQTQFPAMLFSVPIVSSGQFQGMAAIVVNLEFLVERLQSSSTRGLEAFIVDHSGRLVLSRFSLVMEAREPRPPVRSICPLLGKPCPWSGPIVRCSRWDGQWSRKRKERMPTRPLRK